MQAPVPLSVRAAALCLLGGCSAGPFAAMQTPAPGPALSARSQSGQLLASAALDNGQLGAIRGGFDTGSGAELRFAFQEATYVNRNLVQTVVLPTITLAGNVTSGGFVPNTATTSAATPTPLPAPDAGLPSAGDVPITVLSAGATSRPNLSTPYVASGSRPSFSWINLDSGSTRTGSVTPMAASLGDAGATSIVTTLGGGGLSNIIGNTANGQLVQQVTRVDISTSGLSGLLQGARSPVLDNLRNLQTLPR